MKKISFSGLLFFMAAVIFFSCQKKEEVMNLQGEPSMEAVVLTEPLLLEDGSALPEGTTIQEKQDPHGVAYIHFQLPENYRFITEVAYTDKNSGRVELAGNVSLMGSVSCDCTEGTGCNPFVVEGEGGTASGCTMSDGCTKCTQTKKAIAAGFIAHTLRAEIISLEEGVSIIVDEAELKSLKAPVEGMFEDNYIRQEIENFVSGFQKSNLQQARAASSAAELPEGYAYVPVNAFGYLMLVPMERKLLFTSEFMMDPAVRAVMEGECSCKCNSGSSGCALKSKSVLIGSAKWCEAGTCSSCTLNTP